MYGIEDVNC